jgi:hypothetical protein
MNLDLLDQLEQDGNFWQPGAEDNKVPGHFRYTPQGSITVELPGGLPNYNPFVTGIIPRIFGQFADGTRVTLLDVLVKKFQMGSHGGGSAEIEAHRCLTGGHFDLAAFRPRHMSLRFTSLEEWLGYYPFSIIRSEASRDFNVTVNFRAPPGFSLGLPGRSLTLSFHYGVSQTSSLVEATLRYRATMGFASQAEQTLDDWLQVVNQSRNLLTLLVGQPVTPREIRFAEVSGDSMDFAEVYFAAVYQAERVQERAYEQLMPASRAKLGSGLDCVFQRWFDGARRIQMAADSYFYTVYNSAPALELRYLNITQSLESFHRAIYPGVYLPTEKYQPILSRLVAAIPEEIRADQKASLKSRLTYGNEYSLRKRIGELVDSLPKEIRDLIIRDEQHFFERVVKTRNYLTHYDERDKDTAYSGIYIHHAAERLVVLLHVLFLRYAEVSDALIIDMLKNNARINWTLSQKLSAS